MCCLRRRLENVGEGVDLWSGERSGRKKPAEVTSPTNPSSSSRTRPRRVLPSLPQMPTARPPATLMRDTSDLFTLPTSTISTISMVSASVTRNPFRNLGSMPTSVQSRPSDHVRFGSFQSASSNHVRFGSFFRALDVRRGASLRCVAEVVHACGRMNGRMDQ